MHQERITLTCRDIEYIYALHDFVRLLDFGFHVHTTHLGSHAAQALRRPGHDGELFVLLPPMAQVANAVLQLGMRGE